LNCENVSQDRLGTEDFPRQADRRRQCHLVPHKDPDARAVCQEGLDRSGNRNCGQRPSYVKIGESKFNDVFHAGMVLAKEGADRFFFPT
jgi:hypothetical protein